MCWMLKHVVGLAISLLQLKAAAAPFDICKESQAVQFQEISKSFAHKPLLFKNAKVFQYPDQLNSLVFSKLPFDYEVRKLDKHNLYYLKLSSPAAKSLTFDRLEVFAEIEPGHVASDADLPKLVRHYKIEGGSYDFNGVDIARFFSTAEKNHVQLNPMECRLRTELLSVGLLKKTETAYTGLPNSALIAVSTAVPGVSQGATRDDIDHEFNHGVYFTEPKYRQAAQRLWNSLSLADHAYVQRNLNLFAGYHFKDNPDLLIREFVAYFRTATYPNGYMDFIKSYRAAAGDDSYLSSLELDTIEQLQAKVQDLDSESAVYSYQ